MSPYKALLILLTLGQLEDFVAIAQGSNGESFCKPETYTSQYRKTLLRALRRIDINVNLAANFDHFPSGGNTKKHMCPNETLQLECSKLNSLNVYIEWRARDSGSSKFIDVASCNNSQKCTLRGHSQEFDEITVMGVSKGSLIIKRSTRETKKKNLTFACGISDGSTTTWHAVVIDLSTKCIWAQERSNVNLTDHLIKMVQPWEQVKDLYIRSMPNGIEKIAFCKSQPTSCYVFNHGWSGFQGRFRQNDGAVVLKRIKRGDDGLLMRIDYNKRHGGRQEQFTLKIRLDVGIPKGTNYTKSNSNQTFPDSKLVRGFQNSTIVQIESGKLVGKTESVPLGKSVLTYLGIPYAEPPVDELRFSAPKRVKPWTGVRQATDFKAACPQPADFPIPNVRVGEADEDCLYLNVFIPKSTKKTRDKKAVMVWIQGHNFTFGSSAHYPAHILASFNDVIVVTFNYRLGILGFLNIPGTDLKGNYGMYDQVMALQWVKNNIACFGGDPNKVTIFGEGAGGMSVSLHLISPLTKGLFQRAIIQSGFATSPLLRSNGASDHTLKELKKVAKCQPDMELTRCLRSRSLEEIIYTQKEFSSLLPAKLSAEITSPVPDGKFLPEFPQRLFEKREFPDKSVDVIIGLASHEGALDLVLKAGDLTHVNRDEFASTVKRAVGLWQNRDRHKVIEGLVKYRYTDHNDPRNKTAIRKMMLEFESDFKFLAPAMSEASALAETRNRIYLYVFEHRPDLTQFPPWAGTVRGMDVSFVFGAPFKQLSSLIDYFAPRFSEIEKGFSLYMMKLWTNFAKCGSPTPPGSSKVTWRPFTKEEQFYLALDVKPRLKQRFRASQVAFWNNFISKIGRRGRKGKATPRSSS